MGDVVANLILIDSFILFNQKKAIPTEEFNQIKKSLLENEFYLLQPITPEVDRITTQMATQITYRMALARSYMPKKYMHKITLIKPSEKIDMDHIIQTEDNGWFSFAPQLKITVTTGNHNSMLKEPHVKSLAHVLRENLLHAK
ncbi:MAG: hypothetical protein ACD_42C00203G0001 [uncultured bacterium]|nr:MAG: hypothetical protein ACD_42C00203G0001 [uncultured bacterium]